MDCFFNSSPLYLKWRKFQLNPFLKREDVDDKGGILDVKLQTKNGNVINIEIQVVDVSEMPERILFYASKMITEQISTGQSYKVIKRAEVTEDSIKYIHVQVYPALREHIEKL